MKQLYANDQFGNTFGPLDAKRPKASLLDLMGRRSASPMYIDTKSGDIRHIGYVVSPVRGSGDSEHWCRFSWETIEAWKGSAQ